MKGWEKMPLFMDWCSAAPAKHACEQWHYTGILPLSPYRIGVWERGVFVGVVLYGYGAGMAVCSGKKYGLAIRGEVAELSRVALKGERSTPTSKILARSIQMLRVANPKLRMLVSYADAKSRGHMGTIYQATNWIYEGVSTARAGVQVGDKYMHNRTHAEKFKYQKNRPGVSIMSYKHRYLYPLDKEVADRLESFRQPYPKRVESDTSDTPGDQSGEGGAAPTSTL